MWILLSKIRLNIDRVGGRQHFQDDGDQLVRKFPDSASQRKAATPQCRNNPNSSAAVGVVVISQPVGQLLTISSIEMYLLEYFFVITIPLLLAWKPVDAIERLGI
jgi:hypothetical protein